MDGFQLIYVNKYICINILYNYLTYILLIIYILKLMFKICILIYY